MRLLASGEGCYVVARQEARLQFNEPVRADHQGHPLPGQLRLEVRLVELRVAESGESRGPAQHSRDETLLSHDCVCEVAKLGDSDEVQHHLRLAPHSIERIIPLEKRRDGVVRGVAGVDSVARLDRDAKGRPTKIDHGRDRLRPPGGDRREYIDLSPDAR